MIPNKNIKLISNYVVGPLVFSILLYSIYTQLQQQTGWQSFQSLALVYSTSSALQLSAVVLLMVVNWGIEAKKWQIAMRLVTPHSFGISLRSIFSGNTIAFFTPNRVGEYFGRMLHLECKDRIKSIPITIVCSISQLLITLIAGTVGLIFIKNPIENHFADESRIILLFEGVLYVSGLIAILLTIFYFRVGYLIDWLGRIRWMVRWTRYAKVLEVVNATILMQLLSLSGIRYLVFIVQYLLLFSAFGVDIAWWQAFWAVSVVFLVIAILPGMGFLSELGIRWIASLQMLQLFSSNVTGIFATSLVIWIVNLVIPAIVGGVMLMRLKIFRKQESEMNYIN